LEGREGGARIVLGQHRLTQPKIGIGEIRLECDGGLQLTRTFGAALRPDERRAVLEARHGVVCAHRCTLLELSQRSRGSRCAANCPSATCAG